MSTKKEYTIEELEAQYKLAEEKTNALKDQIEQKKREEKEFENAKLAAIKKARKSELDEAIDKCKTLLEAYIDDYGFYSCATENIFDLFNSKFWNLII